MEITITRERPDNPDAVALLQALDEYLNNTYPPGGEYGYSVQKMLQTGIIFYLIRSDGQAVGCGGIEIQNNDHAEIKRVFVKENFRGLHLGVTILQTLELVAQTKGVKSIRLQTGIHQQEAIALYEHYGYSRITAFPPYLPGDEMDVFFEKRLG